MKVGAGKTAILVKVVSTEASALFFLWSELQ